MHSRRMFHSHRLYRRPQMVSTRSTSVRCASLTRYTSRSNSLMFRHHLVQLTLKSKVSLGLTSLALLDWVIPMVWSLHRRRWTSSGPSQALRYTTMVTAELYSATSHRLPAHWFTILGSRTCCAPSTHLYHPFSCAAVELGLPMPRLVSFCLLIIIAWPTAFRILEDSNSRTNHSTTQSHHLLNTLSRILHSFRPFSVHNNRVLPIHSKPGTLRV